MAERNLDLNERVEASRDPHRIGLPVQFELSDIYGDLRLYFWKVF